MALNLSGYFAKEIFSCQESNQFHRHPACSLASTLSEINMAPTQKIVSYK